MAKNDGGWVSAPAGMTLRQWYKGMAFAGYNASDEFASTDQDKKAAWAGEDADALIAEDGEAAK